MKNMIPVNHNLEMPYSGGTYILKTTMHKILKAILLRYCNPYKTATKNIS